MTDLEEIDTQLAKYNRIFEKKGLVFHRMCFCEKRVLVLVYDKYKLSELLQEKGYRAYMIACGYKPKATLEEDLALLEKHLKQGDDFPHEIGVFLGYPLEDVLGYVLNKGKNYKYTGYWKVYGDVKKARRLFNCYEECRGYILKQITKGTLLQVVVSDN